MIHDLLIIALAIGFVISFIVAIYQAINHPPRPKIPDTFYAPRPSPQASTKHVLVFAGDHRQFMWWLNWQKKYDPRRCRYVYRPEDIAGIHPEHIFAIERVGEYWKHPAWNEPQVRQLLQWYETWRFNHQ